MERNKKGTLKKSLFSFFLTILILMGVRWGLVEPYVVPSGSMIPTLLVNDHILVDKTAFGWRVPFTQKWLGSIHLPSRGDIVVFKSKKEPSYIMVKRVVGLPGDRIRYTARGSLVVNQMVTWQRILHKDFNRAPYYRVTTEELMLEPESLEFYEERLGEKSFRTVLERGHRHQKGDYQVPTGHIFLMGDNRDRSGDSRFWGSLPIENLLGKVRFVWLSCRKRLEGVPFLCDPTEIRWDRLFHRVF